MYTSHNQHPQGVRRWVPRCLRQDRPKGERLAASPLRGYAATLSQRGVSLVELIMFIVIVGVALAGILLVMNTTTKSSADPLIHKQALAVAESLLEEIESQNFSNPPGGFTGAATQANRASFDDIMDYNGFVTTGVYPANGNALAVQGLQNYNVSGVVVTRPLAADWGSIPAASAAQITVTVTDPSGQALAATGYRVDY